MLAPFQGFDFIGPDVRRSLCCPAPAPLSWEEQQEAPFHPWARIRSLGAVGWVRAPHTALLVLRTPGNKIQFGFWTIAALPAEAFSGFQENHRV